MRLVDPAQNVRHVVSWLETSESIRVQSGPHATQKLFPIIERLDVIPLGERDVIAVQKLQCVAHEFCVEGVHGQVVRSHRFCDERNESICHATRTASSRSARLSRPNI